MSRWFAYHLRNPFGPYQEAMGHAITASAIYNVNRGKGESPVQPEALRIKYIDQYATQGDEDEMMEVVKGYLSGNHRESGNQGDSGSG